MGRDFPASPDGVDWYMTESFKLAYAGLGLTVVALIVTAIGVTFLSVLLMLAGLLCAGGAVWCQLTHPGADNFEERSKSGVLVALASGSVLFAYLVLMTNEWDSLELWVLVLWCINLAAVPVLMLPRWGRRAVVSFLVLFHFGGILTATTAVTVGTQETPWLPTLVWNNVYRKYLLFAYLNNAYHFYSPEPGPPSLVWFLVEFDKGDPEWIRLGRRDQVATRQQYQRLLSLTESVNNYYPSSNSRTQALAARRSAAGFIHNPQIPANSFLTAEQQFREPSPLAKEYLQSYAKYVCRSARSSRNPDAKVKSVKIYRLTHQLISPAELTSGLSPRDPTKYWAFFFGEYAYHPESSEPTKVVELKTNLDPRDDPLLHWKEQNDNGTWRDEVEPSRDPFLYWMLPIYRIPKVPGQISNNLKDYKLIDTLSIHAGVTIEWELD
jgi:hypothetical protein